MRHSATVPQPENKKTELYPVVTGVGFLAVLTGLLYLGVVLGEVIPALRAGNLAWDSLLSALLLLIGVIGLGLSWKWKRLGGLLALISGWALAVLLAFTLDRYPLIMAFLYGSPFILAGALWLIYSAATPRPHH
jgi:hypothetical protein